MKDRKKDTPTHPANTKGSQALICEEFTLPACPYSRKNYNWISKSVSEKEGSQGLSFPNAPCPFPGTQHTMSVTIFFVSDFSINLELSSEHSHAGENQKLHLLNTCYHLG